jgi:uncharacterized protein (DUF1697 family)
MQTFAALLRGINVGGNNILPMTELKALCEEAGFKKVSTYIQSGNVIFESKIAEEKVVSKIESALKKRLQNPVSVIVRRIEDLEVILSNNPFPKANPSHVGVLFLGQKVKESLVEGFSKGGPEEIILGECEVYIHFPIGMGKSKLKFPKEAKNGTVRNINTVKKLAEKGKKISNTL